LLGTYWKVEGRKGWDFVRGNSWSRYKSLGVSQSREIRKGRAQTRDELSQARRKPSEKPAEGLIARRGFDTGSGGTEKKEKD